MREDWAGQAADTVEYAVGLVRDRTVVPARAASKAVVYGLLTGFFVVTALVLVIVAFFRGVFVLTGEVWLAYMIVGTALVLAGIACWTRRNVVRDEPSAR